MNDEVYNYLLRYFEGDGIPHRELRTPEHLIAYRKFQSGMFNSQMKNNVLTGREELRIVHQETDLIIPKISELADLVKYFHHQFKGIGARKLAVNTSKLYTGMGEKVLRRQLELINASPE
jgi:hypothetical protein